MRYISRNAFRIKNRRGKMRENASYFYRLQDQSVLEMLLVFLEGGTWRQVYVKVISRSSRMRAVLFWGLLQRIPVFTRPIMIHSTLHHGHFINRYQFIILGTCTM